jgi:undecaprenyl-phosphate 4-deoxy-4-formamido-L-arabinose transferase
MPAVSIVVPVYRAELTLRELYRQLVPALELTSTEYEVIFVEDCGGDASWSVIESLSSRDDRVRGIRLTRSFGQHKASLCGIRSARHEVIVTMDDDLQHPAHERGCGKKLRRVRQRFPDSCGAPSGFGSQARS